VARTPPYRDRPEERPTVPTPTSPPVGAATTGQDFVLLSVMQVQKEIGALTVRIEAIERTNAELLKSLEKITPQIEHVYGFSQHTAPHLASKAELENLRTNFMTEIRTRPTSTMILTVLAIVLAIVGLPFVPDWWSHVKAVFPQSAPVSSQSAPPPTTSPPATPR
jgi:uncharacterized small protein (DUF1192 family)